MKILIFTGFILNVLNFENNTNMFNEPTNINLVSLSYRDLLLTLALSDVRFSQRVLTVGNLTTFPYPGTFKNKKVSYISG